MPTGRLNTARTHLQKVSVCPAESMSKVGHDPNGLTPAWPLVAHLHPHLSSYLQQDHSSARMGPKQSQRRGRRTNLGPFGNQSKRAQEHRPRLKRYPPPQAQRGRCLIVTPKLQRCHDELGGSSSRDGSHDTCGKCGRSGNFVVHNLSFC